MQLGSFCFQVTASKWLSIIFWSLTFSSNRIISADHRLESLRRTVQLLTLVCPSKFVRVSQSLAENLKSTEKCIMLISARTGKECITWRMFRTLYTPSSRHAEKNVTAFYVMRLTLQSIINQICRKCTSSAMKSASGQESAPTKQFRGR